MIMKQFLMICIFALGFSQGVLAQRLHKSDVPSVITNHFQQNFPKALDVEWKKKGDLYNVEFELGITRKDHEVWYNAQGQLVKHEEEISKSELPVAVVEKIQNEFKGYRVEDPKKILEGSKTTYEVELKKGSEEWKVIFDADGTIIRKKVD
jgi:hypothetical protein